MHYPSRAVVAVHAAGRSVRLLRQTDVLRRGLLIPKFALSVAEVFALVDTV